MDLQFSTDEQIKEELKRKDKEKKFWKIIHICKKEN